MRAGKADRLVKCCPVVVELRGLLFALLVARLRGNRSIKPCEFNGRDLSITDIDIVS